MTLHTEVVSMIKNHSLGYHVKVREVYKLKLRRTTGMNLDTVEVEDYFFSFYVHTMRSRDKM